MAEGEKEGCNAVSCVWSNGKRQVSILTAAFYFFMRFQAAVSNVMGAGRVEKECGSREEGISWRDLCNGKRQISVLTAAYNFFT